MPYIHYIDVKSNEQHPWASPSPDIIIKTIVVLTLSYNDIFISQWAGS